MNLKKPEIDKIFEIIVNSLRKVYELDRYLIVHNLHERTIVGRFAIYFQKELNQHGYSNYNMDVEYNKNYSDQKRTKNFEEGTLPDVIVHKRGSNRHNLCMIEFKKTNGEGIKRDLDKLKDFTNEKGVYRYGIGYFITINHDSITVLPIERGLEIELPFEVEMLV